MKLTMRLGVRSYDIIIKQGGLSRVGQLINLNRRVLVVSDTGVPEAYLKTVLAQCREGVPVVLPQGEGTKSLECFGQLLTVMLEHGFTRGDAVLDLAGFAAASYMRGVTFINCPTTTLSQIDSSIGGKTAINLAGTKNTVGAFYQPSLVVADPDTLKSLPERHFINGLAEAVKAGLIADEGLFELFETEDAHEKIEEIVLGHPKNMDGTEGPRAEKSRAVAHLLTEATGLEVVLWDERRSSIEAHGILHANGRKEKKHRQTVDAVAASLILEGYLGTLR